MVQKRVEGRPYEGGAQPVQERRAEVPAEGRSLGQIVIVAISVLVVLAAVLWVLIPLGAR